MGNVVLPRQRLRLALVLQEVDVVEEHANKARTEGERAVRIAAPAPHKKRRPRMVSYTCCSDSSRMQHRAHRLFLFTSSMSLYSTTANLPALRHSAPIFSSGLDFVSTWRVRVRGESLGMYKRRVAGHTLHPVSAFVSMP